MDVAALVIAGLALLVSVLTAWSSHRNGAKANRIATNANSIAADSLAEARSAKVGEVWAAVIESVNERATLNPLAEDVGAPLRRSRSALMALVDALPEWKALGAWLALEHGLGSLASRADMEDMSGDRERLPERQMRWGMALVTNLRRFRATGYDEATMKRLTENAREQLTRLCEARGWDVPPEKMDGIEPLDGVGLAFNNPL